MRLINRDEFIRESKELYNVAGWGERDVHFSLADLECNIDMMPIIDAIPIEWLEKNAITQLDFGLGIRMLIQKYREEQNAEISSKST